MRYNKIFAGPATEVLPQVVEAPATDDSIKPGLMITLAAGKFTRAAVATLTQLFVAQDNYLAMLGTNDAYDADDTVIGLAPLDNQLFNARFAASAALTKGDAVALGANGLLVKLPGAAGSYIVVGYADETVTLGAGGEDLIRVRFIQPRQVTVS